MKFFLTICFTLFCCSLLYAGDSTKNYMYDSSLVTVRTYPDSVINKYKNDPEYQYEKKIAKEPSAWDRFWIWFWRMIGGAGSSAITWIIIVVALLFLIFGLMKSKFISPFRNKSYSDTTYKVEQEDINTIQFDVAINEAMENGNYRLAVRLLYLQNLKLLSDKGLIEWKPGKTNSDYRYELRSQLQPAFAKLTTLFEYAWYGEHVVTRLDCTDMKDQLLQFQTQF